MRSIRLPNHRRSRMQIISLLLVAEIILSTQIYAQSETFVPIPPDTRALYGFNFKSLFYSDETARQKDLNEFHGLRGQFDTIKSTATSSAVKLVEALDLYQKMGILSQRLHVYGDLRYSVNTNDIVVQREGQKTSDDFDTVTALLKIQVQALSDDQIRTFVGSNSELGKYRFLLQNWRRDHPHTGSEAEETLLSQLSSPLNPFDSRFYNLMGKHLLDATMSIGNRQVNVTQQGGYNDALRAADRGLRESAFHKRLTAYKSQSDLYAYALLQKIKTANAVSEVHKFPNAVAESLYSYYLTPETVDAVLKAFRDHSSLAIRYQKAERSYQQKLLGLAEVKPWDLEMRPPESPEPRFTISEASEVVIRATGILKHNYQDELKTLLNPVNGRLDIVPGENREAGDYSWGAYGPSWVFYMNGYNGYLADVIMLGHESAHVVHASLSYKSNVPWVYSDGARYFTEGFAKVNELLILDHLLKNARNQSDRLFFLRELNSKLASVKFASMFWAAYATSFEVEAYRRAKAGTLNKPEELHEIWAELGRRWVLDFDKYPDLKYSWAGTHHFFDAARYYSNYLFAWLLAVTLYERFQSDPTSIDKYITLMKSGFPDEPANLLRNHLGIDLSDPKTLDRAFSLVEKQLNEFERLVGNSR